MQIRLGNTYISKDGQHYAKIVGHYLDGVYQSFYKFRADLYKVSNDDLVCRVHYSENGKFLKDFGPDNYDLVALYQEEEVNYWLEE
jgi:hypothetical protein